MSDRDFNLHDEVYRESVADWLDVRDELAYEERPTRDEYEDDEDRRR